ncbi:MAG: YihY/virulence factor BrkB family protein [Chloroflexi bacterium]|nr:YihY/virulence factor BrkB family protein [Chloroflexota bacterium]
MKLNLSPGKRRRIAIRTKESFFFIREVVNEFLTDNCPHLAASVSYYVLLTIFPLTLAAITIVGAITSDPHPQNNVVQAIGDFLPVSDEVISDTIGEVGDEWVAAGAISIILLIWGSMAVFSALRKALNAAWGIRTPRPFFMERFLELGMMLGVALLLLVSFAINAGVEVVRGASDTTVGGFFSEDIFWNAVRILITTGLAFITFIILYRVIPNARIRWGDIWGGALIAAVGFVAAQQVFFWYVTPKEPYSVIYGSLGTIIALMVWVYISAVILLFCAKLTAVHSRRRVFTPNTRTWTGRRKIGNRIETNAPSRRFGGPDPFETSSISRNKRDDR